MSKEKKPIKLPESCRAGLLNLYAAAKQAEREYMLALNSAVSALGLDPSKPNKVNLDNGDIEVAE